MRNSPFDKTLSAVEGATSRACKTVATDFHGNLEEVNYKSLVEEFFFIWWGGT
jgi:hypothetical protein